MAHAYVAVGWNAAKKRYDRWLLLLVLAGLLLFGGLTAALRPDATAETLVIRSFGFVAFALLHVVLAIGPLCRLDARFLPLLYNRRHLGVAMFVLALGHGTLSFVLYHTLGVVSPLVSLFAGDGGGGGASGVPFQPFGAVALGILFVMAATSHDFWLRNLSAPAWKALHMGVYVAYALLVAHVLLGYAQSQDGAVSVAMAVVVTAGALALAALHVAAARREVRIDGMPPQRGLDGFVAVCGVDELADGAARAAIVAGERVAVFRHGAAFHAVSGVCKHQGGPLAEGRIVDGCITCPWHGYQYRPEDGCAPPPFDDRLATFPVRVVDGRVFVGATPLPPGTRAQAAAAAGPAAAPSDDLYVGYLDNASPAQTARVRRFVLVAAAVAAIALTLVAITQRPLVDSRFEFGVWREFRGVVEARPAPMLRVPRPGGGSSAYLLVAQGKHGADALVAPWVGKGVSLRGSLVHQGGQTMVEVEPDSLAPADVRVDAPGAAVPLGRYTLRGEIVDSKCHLGVMNPGERRTHRACARLCIRGGVPPMLWAEDAAGEVRRLLLVDVDGKPVNDRVLDLVGDPVEVTGDVEQLEGWLVLRADPAAIRRTP